MIKVTNEALNYLKSNLATQPAETLGVRIGLQDYGCSGLGYTIDFTDQLGADDTVFEFDGVKVVVGNENLKFFNGMTINLIEEGPQTMLDFENPNVEHACGCGESVTFKEEME